MMRTATDSYLPPLCLLVLGFGLTLVGCRSQPGSASFTYGSIGWSSADVEPVVPGVDQAMVEWYLSHRQLRYVVWTDLAGGAGSNSGSSGTSSAGVVRHQTQLESSDDERLEFEYLRGSNGDGDSRHTGTVTVSGVDCQLKEGALILVSTRGSKVAVRQLDLAPLLIDYLRDRAQSQESLREALKSWVTDDSDVREFFERVES